MTKVSYRIADFSEISLILAPTCNFYLTFLQKRRIIGANSSCNGAVLQGSPVYCLRKGAETHGIDCGDGAVAERDFFLAGLIDAVSGGGGLPTLPMCMVAGIPTHQIAGTNQCSCLFGAATAMGRYARKGKIHWPTAAVAAPLAVIGSFLGARLNLYLPERWLQIVMLALLPVAAVVIMTNRSFGQEDQSFILPLRARQVRAAGIGLVLGAYVGFYGAGGGTFILLTFTLLNRMDLVSASGNAKVCGFCATLTASVTYAASGTVIWQVVLPCTVCNILGDYLGAGLAPHRGVKIIRPMFMVVLALLFVRLAVTVFV